VPPESLAPPAPVPPEPAAAAPPVPAAAPPAPARAPPAPLPDEPPEPATVESFPDDPHAAIDEAATSAADIASHLLLVDTASRHWPFELEVMGASLL
jgi:hypothetical protein